MIRIVDEALLLSSAGATGMPIAARLHWDQRRGSLISVKAAAGNRQASMDDPQDRQKLANISPEIWKIRSKCGSEANQLTIQKLTSPQIPIYPSI